MPRRRFRRFDRATTCNYWHRPPAPILLRLGEVTQPRKIEPGATYLITRRTLRRHHLLAPDGRIDQHFLYALSVCAKKFSIEVHLPTLMSTHEHLVLTDTAGRLPDFLRELHRLMALGTKAIRKWEGAVWDHEPSSVVELRTPQAIIEELAYAMANPVKAGLVRYASDWPGVTARPSELGNKRWRVRRPDVFFDPDNPQWPEHVELELTLPKMLLDCYNPEQIRTLVTRELDRQEREARAEVKCNGRKFLGADRCRKASPYRRAKSSEPLRSRNPTFAVGRGNKDAFFQAVHALRAFRNAYRLAREQWRTGMRSALFPPGTWWMRCFHGVRIAGPPAPA